MVIISRSFTQTQQIGEMLGEVLPAGSLIVLVGELGAGKTCLAQGIIKGLGAVEAYIASPSYTLINEYQGRYPIYHFDFYRLSNLQQVEELGCEEYFFGQGVTIVEWGDKVRELLPRHYLELKLDKLAKDVVQVDFIPIGDEYRELVDRVYSGYVANY